MQSSQGQANRLGAGLSVMGVGMQATLRNPHKGSFERETDHDFRLAEAALRRVGMADFAERSFLTLSGGRSSASSSPALGARPRAS
jgi:ABC-type cobalamin/Fe3+-siderophores transport system ATPase subunit